MAEKKHVLFVCMGNICRSPVGEAVLRHMASKRALNDRVIARSAGTIDYHAGEPADPRMREAAGRRGYALTGRARQIQRRDLEAHDLIVAMDQDNLSDIHKLDPYERYRDKIRLLSDFIPNSQLRDVPDPYYGGRDGFERVITMVEAGCVGILDSLTSEITQEASGVSA